MTGGYAFPHIYRRRSDGRGMLYAWFAAMHTRVDVSFISCESESALLETVRAIHRRIAEIERVGNCFDPASELSVINRSAADGKVPVGPELERIIGDCLRYNHITNGLFDITAGSPCGGTSAAHDIILPCDGTISFRRRGLRINLSGYLKGYALEQVRPIITAAGIADALVSMGNSSVMALGGTDEGKGWPVGFGSSAVRSSVVLNGQCLTTSGNDSAQRRHIINPHDGELVCGCRSVSIVNDCATEGEVLSTAHFIEKRDKFSAFGEYLLISHNL